VYGLLFVYEVVVAAADAKGVWVYR
jgi:hypothetical protein